MMLKFINIILFGAVFTTAFAHKIITVPASPSTETSTVSYTGDHSGLDAPKVQPINDTTYEW